MVDSSTLSRDVVSEGSARFFFYASSAVVIVFLTREFTPTEYGTLFLALSVLTVARLFSSFGIAKSAAKHVSAALDADDGQARHVVRASLRDNVLTIAVVASATVVGAPVVADALGEPAIAGLLAVGSLYVVFATLYNYARVVLQGFQDIQASAFVYGVEGLGRLAGVLVLVSLGFGLLGGLVGYVTGFVLAAAVGFWLLARHLASRPEGTAMASGLKRRIRRYSVPLAVTRGAWVLDREVDLILVGYVLNPAVVGFYAVSKQVVTFASGPAGSIGFSIGPKFTEQAVREDETTARRTYERILVSVLLFYAPAVTGLFVLAEPVIRLVFGDEYLGVVPILQVFCGAILLMAVTKSTEDVLDFLGRASARARFKIATSLGNAVLTVALLRWQGAVGAAVATVAMQALYAVLCLSVVNGELDLRVRRVAGKAGRVLVVTAGMAAAVVPLARIADGGVTVVATIACGVLVWAVLASVGGLLDWRELADAIHRGG